MQRFRCRTPEAFTWDSVLLKATFHVRIFAFSDKSILGPTKFPNSSRCVNCVQYWSDSTFAKASTYCPKAIHSGSSCPIHQ